MTQNMVQPNPTEGETNRANEGTLICRPEIEHFLHLYDDALSICDAKLNLFSLPGAATFSSGDAAAVAHRAAGLARRQKDVYLHIHLHGLPAGESSRRGSLQSVRVAIGLFSDIDARGPGRKKPPESLCPTVADAVWIAEQFNTKYNPLQISLLVSSGHGCYPAVLFREPLLLDKPEDRILLESLQRRFHDALHRIASERGWTGTVDYCDLAKVLRLPGCVNWKDVTKPQPVRVVHEDPARFDPSDLQEFLPESEQRVKVFFGTRNEETCDGVEVALNIGAEIQDTLLAAMSEGHPLFVPTWNHQRNDLNDQSCSGYDMAIAGIGVACRLTDQQIADLVVVSRRRFKGPKQERKGAAYQKYLQRTVAKAREGSGVSSEEAQRQWDELRQHLESPAANFPAPASASDKDPGAGHRGGAQDPGVSDGMKGGDRDEDGNRKVRSPLDFLLAKVRATGDVKLVYDNITVMASLPDAAVAIAYQELKSALGPKLNYHHFNRAIRDARMRQRHTAQGQEEDDPRPIIRTDDRLLDDIAAEGIAALEAANHPPVVFRRGGRLVMIHPDEDGHPVIMQATEAMMRGRLARVARFFRDTKDGPKRVSPPEDLTRDVLVSNQGDFPALGVLTQIPILRPDGTSLMEAGYDPITRAYYLPTPGFELSTIPAVPSKDDVASAVRLLNEAIGEFPFESPGDKANCIGLLLTPILRVAFRMKTPLALIDASKWGTGKTLLAMVVYAVITGSEGTVCAAPTTEEEWRKRMVSILERGSAVIIIDNVDQTLRSPSLSAVLTTAYWEDRVLGRSEDVRLPNVSTWIATGNNVTLGAEMARRTFRIRLDAKVSNPAKRAGFKRSEYELIRWIRTERGSLVAAVFTLVRAWWAAGKPKGNVPAFGSFDDWAEKVGGILQHAGVEGFLMNLDAVQQEADEESCQWDTFLRALVMTFRDTEFTVAELSDRVRHDGGLLSLSFPDEIGHPDERVDGGPASLVRRIGKALARKCGTRFGHLELRVERGRPDTHTKVGRWKVAGDLAALLSREEHESAGLSNKG